MKRIFVGFIVLFFSLISGESFSQAVNRQTIDEKFKSGAIKYRVLDKTHDGCDKRKSFIIKSTTDGDIILNPGETKFFEIDQTDGYTKSGGWYWTCEGNPERSRISGSSYIMVVRTADTGAATWYALEIQ